jgi:Asp-tRNA(Asn)/Glu-tRNA(Gln) amidotransferase A subunit family amidase
VAISFCHKATKSLSLTKFLNRLVNCIRKNKIVLIMKTSRFLLFALIIVLIASVGLNYYFYKSKGNIRYQIANAEKLYDLNFTPDQRDSMVTGIQGYLNSYKEIHKITLDNSVAPSFIFSPVPLSYPFSKEQKKISWDLPQSVEMPKNIEQLCFYSVADLSVLVKQRKVKSVELTKMYIDRLKRYDPELHCIITLLEERALKQAQKADEEIAKGIYRGPLHGIPYGVKDLLALKGYPFTFGSKIYKNQIPEITSPVIQKLDEAGAVLVAKLSLGELAMDDVWYGGLTRNPWNTAKGSSGSSAGSASATSAGLVAFSIGSETWGSIMSPSTVCGVTGLRPTFGRVSRTGAMALSWTMDKIGPICRTAEDCALVFDVIRGKDGQDPCLVDLPFNYNPKKDLKELRVAYVEDYFKDPYDGRGNDSLTLKTLREMGVNLTPVKMPEQIPAMALSIMLEAEAAAAFADLTLTKKDTMMVRQFKGGWPNIFRQARFIPAVEYIQASRIRVQLIAAFMDIFKKFDIIVCPTWGGNQELMTNLTGHPGLLVPNGFGKDKTPTGITFIADWYNESDLLLIGSKYQKKAEFYKNHPAKFIP